jgi:hypothetical protein
VALFVHYDGASADNESGVTKASKEHTHAPRRQTKQER